MHARRRGIFLAISCFFGLADDLWFFVLCQGERVTVAVVESSCLWDCYGLLQLLVLFFSSRGRRFRVPGRLNFPSAAPRPRRSCCVNVPRCHTAVDVCDSQGSRERSAYPEAGGAADPSPGRVLRLGWDRS